MKAKTFALTAMVCTMPGLLHAQFDFQVEGRTVQIHSFGSQGFLYTNQNNYMSMPTSKGSFAFTDGGANISSQITDKFRVGAQVYVRNIGELGNWHPTLDWAFVDYRFKSWFGVRSGRVKTTLGLYNDVQDMDSLHTFALLPQSMYPIDWRSSSISHDGGAVSGEIPLKRFGTLSYVGYAGMQPQDPRAGYIIAAKTNVIDITELGGRHVGGDLRWTSPFGFVAGVSVLDRDLHGEGTMRGNPYHEQSNVDFTTQYYGQYTFRNFRMDVEYRRNLRDKDLYWGASKVWSNVDQRDWYVAGTYRVTKHLEFGVYRSIYQVDARKSTEPATAHLNDTVAAARVDLNAHFYVKLEGHFMDGAPTSPSASRGFYTISNPNGVLPNTNLFMIRTGFSF